MSKKLFAILVLCVVAASALQADADVETEVDIPTTRPRKGKKLVKARIPGRSFGNQKVVIVPKGDPRAQSPPAPPKKVKAKEPRVIVEAEAVPEPIIPAPIPAPLPAGVVPPAPARPVLKAVAPASAGNCLRNYNAAAAGAKAATYQSTYKARGVKYNQQLRQFGINAKYSDCSSFVFSVLDDLNMGCLFTNGRYTAYMNEQIAARGGYKQIAKVGDIVMWGSHTGMIVRVCSPTTFSMVAMGNSGAGRAECKTVAQLKSWGSGGWKGFWTPRP
jgi:hypothetical protein